MVGSVAPAERSDPPAAHGVREYPCSGKCCPFQGMVYITNVQAHRRRERAPRFFLESTACAVSMSMQAVGVGPGLGPARIEGNWGSRVETQLEAWLAQPEASRSDRIRR